MKSTNFLLVLSVVALLFAACKKEDPAANVFLKKIVIESVDEGMPFVATNEYVWENNLLVAEKTTTMVMGMTIPVNLYYEYEGSNVVHSYSVDDTGDTIHSYYTYENGKLKGFESRWVKGTITGYNSKGEIISYEEEAFDVVHKYELEWKDGNLVKAKMNRVYEDGSTMDTTFVYNYDDKVSAYSNIPFVLAIDDVETLGNRASKNNMLYNDCNYEYKSGRLVRVYENGVAKTSFYYTDGIGPDEE